MLSLITNINSVISKCLTKLQAIKPQYDKSVNEAADETLKAVRDRIHVRGQASDGSPIGQYDTTPMYAAGADSPAGKTSKSVFANGKGHRSRYFPGGYNEYKSSLGKNTGSVNLILSGEMRDSYQVVKTSEGYSLGWNNADVSKRAVALEEKYGKKIWALTDAERKAMIESIKGKIDLH